MLNDLERTVAVVPLRISSRHTTLILSRHVGTNATIRLNIGFEPTAKKFLEHGPPTPGELELAIYAIEDEIARADKIIPNEGY